MIGVALPFSTSFFLVEKFESLTKKINKTLSERLNIENLDQKGTKLDPRLKLKSVAVATFSTIVYLACMSTFYEVRVHYYGYKQMKIG